MHSSDDHEVIVQHLLSSPSIDERFRPGEKLWTGGLCVLAAEHTSATIARHPDTATAFDDPVDPGSMLLMTRAGHRRCSRALWADCPAGRLPRCARIKRTSKAAVLKPLRASICDLLRCPHGSRPRHWLLGTGLAARDSDSAGRAVPGLATRSGAARRQEPACSGRRGPA